MRARRAAHNEPDRADRTARARSSNPVVPPPAAVPDIAHQELDGRMAVQERPDDVGPGLQGVAVEVRAHALLHTGGEKNTMTREEWEATALTWYRRTLLGLHGSEAERRTREQPAASTSTSKT